MQFDRKDIPMNKMVATTLEAKFHVYDLRTHHPQKGFTSLTEKVYMNTIDSLGNEVLCIRTLSAIMPPLVVGLVIMLY